MAKGETLVAELDEPREFAEPVGVLPEVVDVSVDVRRGLFEVEDDVRARGAVREFPSGAESVREVLPELLDLDALRRASVLRGRGCSVHEYSPICASVPSGLIHPNEPFPSDLGAV